MMLYHLIIYTQRLKILKCLACLNTDSNNYSVFNRGQVESPSHDTIEFFDNCITDSNIDDLDVTDIVLVATSVWYERTGRDETMRKNIIYIGVDRYIMLVLQSLRNVMDLSGK